MKSVKLYFWFIKESQSFMRGHNPIKVFLQSLYKGFEFVHSCNEYTRYEKKHGKLKAYTDLNRVMQF